MKDNQEIGNGLLDMSSNEPHVTITCPLCEKLYMKKVELKKDLYTPCCNVKYKLLSKGGKISIRMSLTKEQTAQFNANFQ